MPGGMLGRLGIDQQSKELCSICQAISCYPASISSQFSAGGNGNGRGGWAPTSVRWIVVLDLFCLQLKKVLGRGKLLRTRQATGAHFAVEVQERMILMKSRLVKRVTVQARLLVGKQVCNLLENVFYLILCFCFGGLKTWVGSFIFQMSLTNTLMSLNNITDDSRGSS